MLFNCIKAEISKLRRSMIWLPIIILPLLSVLLGTFNYVQNIEILSKEWYSLWTQVCLFYNYLFFPVVITVICAYICRLEHTGNNWSTILSQPVPVWSIYFSKIVAVAGTAFIIQMLLGGFYFAAGKLCNIPDLPPLTFILWIFRGWIASLCVIALQMLFSINIRSFAIPVGIALLGGISGIVSLTANFGLFNPYALITLGMNAANPIQHQSTTAIIQFFISNFVFLLLFSGIGVHRLSKKDIKTE